MLKKIKMMLGMATGRPMMNCEQVLERLFDYLDGELEGASHEQVKAHLEVCKQCYPRAEFEKAFLDALHRVESGETCPEAVRESLLAAIQQGGEPGV